MAEINLFNYSLSIFKKSSSSYYVKLNLDISKPNNPRLGAIYEDPNTLLTL